MFKNQKIESYLILHPFTACFHFCKKLFVNTAFLIVKRLKGARFVLFRFRRYSKGLYGAADRGESSLVVSEQAKSTSRLIVESPDAGLKKVK